jgi:hypothetical protein
MATTGNSIDLNDKSLFKKDRKQIENKTYNFDVDL